jgi:hypothetical protein
VSARRRSSRGPLVRATIQRGGWRDRPRAGAVTHMQEARRRRRRVRRARPRRARWPAPLARRARLAGVVAIAPATVGSTRRSCRRRSRPATGAWPAIPAPPSATAKPGRAYCASSPPRARTSRTPRRWPSRRSAARAPPPEGVRSQWLRSRGNDIGVWRAPARSGSRRAPAGLAVGATEARGRRAQDAPRQDNPPRRTRGSAPGGTSARPACALPKT